MKKTMCYILQKRTWSDFDIERLEPVLVSLDKDFILYQVMSKNTNLSPKEIKSEEKYVWTAVEFNA
jgi:hypothetical protein